MENHTSASMYIPSSRVLARLQRRPSTSPAAPAVVSAAPPPPPSPAQLTPPSTSISHISDRGAAESRGNATNTTAATANSTRGVDTPSCNRSSSVPAAAAGAALAPLGPTAAPLGTPYYPSRHRPAASLPLPPAPSPPVPKATSTTTSADEEGVEETKEVRIDAAEDTGDTTTAAAAAAATLSTWLLPREDIAYIFSTLTWNVDLLRLLLPHAPCPLKLPTAQTPAASHPPATPTQPSLAPVAAAAFKHGASENEGGLPREGRAARMEKVGLCASKEEDHLRNEEEKEDEGKETHGKPSLVSGAGVAATTASAAEGAVRKHHIAQPSAGSSDSTDPVRPLPPSPATPQLTWSQYLFRGSHPQHGTPTLSPASGATAAAVSSVLTLALPRSPGDGALMRPAAAAPASIFQSHYVPSLEEFQRDLEVQRHHQQQQHQHQQQQQQQQQSMLSAMRLEQHLQAQQQQQQRRRRAATNRTFFYSPTPSVISLATTAAVLDEEGDERSPSRLHSSPSVQSRSTATQGGPSVSGRSYATAVLAAAAAATTTSARSSPAPSVSTTPSVRPPGHRQQQQQPQQMAVATAQHLTARRLRRRVASSASLDQQGAAEQEGTHTPGVVSPGCSLSPVNNNAGPSLSASLSSRPSLLLQPHTPSSSSQTMQLQQQPSAMMMRAADRLRASIVGAVRDAPATTGSANRSLPHTHTTTRPASTGNASGGAAPAAGRFSGSGGGGVMYGSRLHKEQGGESDMGDARSSNAAHSDGSSSSSDDDDDDAVQWWHSHTSSVANSSASAPGSPVASISSVSFARMWSSAVSGRATPRSSVGGAIGFAAGVTGVHLAHSDALLAMSVSGYGARRGGGGSRRKKKIWRRQKSSRTRRQRAMRVYVPSITEGPKAATLYTAPTAEAQELLMQLQRRATCMGGGAAGMSVGTGSSGTAPRTTPHLPAAPIASNAMPADAMRPSSRQQSPAMKANVAPLLPPPVPALRTPSNLATHSSTVVMGSGDGSLSSRSGNERHAIRSSILHASTEDATDGSATSQHHHQQQQQQQGAEAVSGGRVPQSITTPVNTYLAAARGSLSSASFSSLPRPSAQWSAAAPASSSIVSPDSGLRNGSFVSATPASSVCDMQHGRRLEGRESGGEYCDRASLDSSVTTATAPVTAAAAAASSVAAVRAPATRVELPSWVRERSLSALYYQPWGLELLARYEQQQQQLRRTHQQQQQQQQRKSAGEGGQALSRVGSASIATSGSPAVSPVITPKLSASVTSATAPVSPAASATSAPRRPPLLTRASLSTTNTAAATAAPPSTTPTAAATFTTTTTTTATASASAAAAVPRVSWAAALRHHPPSSHSSSAIPTTALSGAPAATRITTTTTMTNTTVSPRIDQQQQRQRVPPASTVPEWPPELAAAEELDAQEEAFYFFGLQSAPTSAQSLSSSPTTSLSPGFVQRKAGIGGSGGVAGASGVASASSLTSLPQHADAHHDGPPTHQRPYDCNPNDLLHLPTLYLSRQKRSRRRLRACPDDAATARSSTARKGSATSAAAELQSKRASARAAAAAAAAAAETALASTTTATEEENEKAEGGMSGGGGAGAERPTLPTTTAATSKEDLWLFGDAYRRKKAGQLYYPPPPPPTSWPAPRSRRAAPTTVVSAKASPPPASANLAVVPEVAEAESIMHSGLEEEVEEESPQLMEDTGAPTTIAEAAARLLPPASWPTTPPTHAAPGAALDGNEEGEAQLRQLLAPATAAAAGSRASSKEAAAVDEGGAAPAATTASASASASPARTPSFPPLLQPPPAPVVPEVDINFFLQKFLRAVLIIVVTQVRLQERQQQQRAQAMQQQHDLSCPAGAYAMGCGAPPFSAFSGSPPLGHDASLADTLQQGVRGDADHGDSSSSSNSSGGLSAVERHALSFVRHHMSDYRAIMTQFVMRDDREVARRSAQSIFAPVDDPSHAAVAATVQHGTRSSALFDHRVCHACLRASRVNAVYEAAVAADGSMGNDTDDAGAGLAALDDVEAMRTTQVFISGKDAAWQPLLLELLQVSRVVQCYGEGPTPPLMSAATAANTPQQHLLASLEAFLAQPTLPLLRTATTTATATATAAGAGAGASTTGCLSPLQAAAAAHMTEASDAFRLYLLAGYLCDPTAPRNNHSFTTPGGADPTRLSPMLAAQRAERPVRSLLQPLVWYPYAYMPGTANPYAAHTDPSRTAISPAQAASAAAMTLLVSTLPLSGRLLWKWVIPAEDTDTFNLSVFFQSSLFSFMQGGALPPPTTLAVPYSNGGGGNGDGGTGFGPPVPPLHPATFWPPSLAASIDAQLHADAWRSSWGGCTRPPCTCGVGNAAEGDEGGAGDGEVVLVHCSAGMHRSCGILVAFLLWLLYQCRQVVRVERQLGWRRVGQADGEDALMALAAADAAAGDGVEEEEEQAATAAAGLASVPSAAVVCGVGDVAVAPTAGDPLVTSRLLQRCIHHVQSRRSIAVPIRTVQCLLQSFADELQLS